MASSLFIIFLIFISHILPLSVLPATVVEDLANLTPPPDFNTTIANNCLRDPLLRYCNNTSATPMDIVEIFRSTIVASHLCNESKNPNCVESFPRIRIHGRPKTAALYLSFDFFWKYCPLTVVEIELVNNSLKDGFPTNVLSCTQIRTLDLSYNRLSGFLPVQEISRLPNLTHLNLSYNQLSENKISDTELFTRFNASSFIQSGVLPNAKRYKMKVLVLLILFPIIVIILCFCLGWLCIKRPDYLPSTCRRSHKFTSEMIDAATDEFSEQKLVSTSNGVDIYRGTLKDGTEAKIEVYTEKVSKEKRREFAEECEAVFKMRHKNLVRVLGWCNNRNLRALVTEWSNGENLETWLSSSALAVSWRRRLKVVKGVVEGIWYLAEEWPEITFDLSTSSVLLSDDDQEPMISQFKIRDGDNSSINIFKFGLFILEMVTNLRPDTEQVDLERRYLEYIRVHYPDNLERVIDERMKMEERTMEKAKQAITLGLMCTDKPPLKQPSLIQISDLVDSLYESSLRHH